MGEKITDLVYIKQCKKEALIETIKDIVKMILFCCGIIISMIAFIFVMGYIIMWLQPNTGIVLFLIQIIMSGMVIVGIICAILLFILTIYEMYKQHLKKCVERIKSEQKVGEVNG
jgi:uncharacterized protein (DUF2062 family)